MADVETLGVEKIALLTVDALHRDERSIIRTWDIGGKRENHPSFLPYTYIVGDKAKREAFLTLAPSMGLNIVGHEEVQRREFKKPVQATKVFTRSTKDVPKIRSYVKPYGLDTRESDTPFPWRYMRDKGLSVLDPPDEAEPKVKLMSLDLETYCFSEDTEIMTIAGPLNIKNLRQGMSVFSLNPDTLQVEIKPVERTYSIPYSGDMLQIKTKYHDFKITPEHKLLLWRLNRQKAEERRFFRASDLTGGYTFQIPDSFPMSGSEQSVFDLVSSPQERPATITYRVVRDHPGIMIPELAQLLGIKYPACEMRLRKLVKNGAVRRMGEKRYVKFYANDENEWLRHQRRCTSKSQYEMDDWLKLVAWYVTEGCPSGSVNGIAIGQVTPKFRVEIAALLKKMGFISCASPTAFTFSSPDVARWLREYCGVGSRNKKIPEFIFGLSARQREMFLRTMMKGDGAKARFQYITYSRHLNRQISILGCSLGYKIRFTAYGEQLKVTFSSNRGSIVPNRHITREAFSGTVYCLTVADNHTVMAGRNGVFHWIGQCKQGFGSTPKRDPIIIASMAWEEDGKVVKHLVHQGETDEQGLLSTVANIVQGLNPDILLTYNGSGFDFPFLQKRSELLETPLPLGRDGSSLEFGYKEIPYIAGRCAVDLFDIIARDFDEIKDKRLKSVSDLLGIMRKVDRTMIEGRHIADAWDHDRDRLLKYAGDDAVATLLLGKQLLASQYALARVLRCTPQDASNLSRGNQIELFFLREAMERGMLYPNKQSISAEQAAMDQAAGGIVQQPQVGLVGPIDVIDIAGAYPTAIWYYNISPDSYCADSNCLKRHHVAPEVGHRFHYYEDDPGFMPDVVKKLIATRKPLKLLMKSLVKGTPEHIRVDAQQDALKRITNSAYGVFRWQAFRYYFPPVTASITAWVRDWLNQADRVSQERFGLRSIYKDTDALFLPHVNNVHEILNHINKTFPFEMELEGTFSRMLFTAKKRYFGQKIEHIDMEHCVKGRPCQRACQKIRGVETRRGDWAKIARDLQQDIIDAVLHSTTEQEGIRASIHLTRKCVQRIRRGQFDVEDVLIKKEVTKDADEYKNIQPHVEALRRAVGADEMGSYIGADIEYVVLRGKSARQSDRTKIAQLVTEDDLKLVDKDYYVEKQILPVALRILEAFNVSKEALLGQEALF